MNQQKFKLIFTIILMIACFFYISPISFAARPVISTPDSEALDNSTGGTSQSAGNNSDVFNFTNYDNATGNEDADKIAKNAIGLGITLVRTVATGVAIIMITYIAIKYMSAAPSEKADFKKSATIYIVGAILVFAAGNILGIIIEFTTQTIS